MLSKMQLIDEEEKFPEIEDVVIVEKYKSYRRKQSQSRGKDCVYYKKVDKKEDACEVIDKYKEGCTCIVRMESNEYLMAYLYGGIYALEAEVVDVGSDVYIIKNVKTM